MWAHAKVHMWRLKDNLQELVALFPPCESHRSNSGCQTGLATSAFTNRVSHLVGQCHCYKLKSLRGRLDRPRPPPWGVPVLCFSFLEARHTHLHSGNSNWVIITLEGRGRLAGRSSEAQDGHWKTRRPSTPTHKGPPTILMSKGMTDSA